MLKIEKELKRKVFIKMNEILRLLRFSLCDINAIGL